MEIDNLNKKNNTIIHNTNDKAIDNAHNKMNVKENDKVNNQVNKQTHKQTHKQVNKELVFEIVFYLLVFLIYLLWSLMVQYNDSPDEEARYSICQFIFNHGKLPHGGDPEIRLRQWGFSYGFQPILAYMIGAVFMKFTALFTTNIYILLISARFVSVLCGLSTAIYVRKISKYLFEEKKYQWLFTFLTTLLPQAMFMFVYVNVDSIALLSCAMITYYWLKGMKEKWSIRNCIGLGTGIALCALSYYNAYGFILCSIIIFMLSFLSKKTDGKIILRFEWKNFLRKGIIVFAVAFVLAGWWFIRSYILYDGDFLGLKTREMYGELYAETEYLKPSKAKTYYIAGMSAFRMLKETDYIPKVAQSFVGLFGNMSILLTNRIYYFYAALFLIAMTGLLLYKKKGVLDNYNGIQKTAFHISMILCIIIPNFLCAYSSYVSDYQPQGRYVLPMVIPFMFYITAGLKSLIQRIMDKQSMIPVTVICFMTSCCVIDFMVNIVWKTYGAQFVEVIKGFTI